MDEEIKQELADRDRLAKELVSHLRRMGAEAVSFPVYLEDEKYTVVVTHVPVKD